MLAAEGLGGGLRRGVGLYVGSVLMGLLGLFNFKDLQAIQTKTNALFYILFHDIWAYFR